MCLILLLYDKGALSMQGFSHLIIFTRDVEDTANDPDDEWTYSAMFVPSLYLYACLESHAFQG